VDREHALPSDHRTSAKVEDSRYMQAGSSLVLRLESILVVLYCTYSTVSEDGVSEGKNGAVDMEPSNPRDHRDVSKGGGLPLLRA